MRFLIGLFALASSLTTGSVLAQAQVDWNHLAQFPPGVFFRSARPTALDLDAGGVAYIAYAESRDSVEGIGLRRIEPNGVEAWSGFVPLGGVSSPVVAISPLDGGILVAASGLGEARIAKFDANGQLLWNSSLTGPVTGFGSVRLGRALVFDANGAAYVCGRMHTGPHFAFDFDGFVASFDSAGVLRFTTLVPGPLGRADDVFGLRPDAVAGGLRLAGTFDGDDDNSGRASFTARMSTAGALTGVVADSGGALAFVRIMDFEVDASSRAYLLRRMGTTSTNGTATHVTRYDAAGLPFDSLAFTSSQRRPADVDLGADGHVVVVGTVTALNTPGFVSHYDANWALDWDRVFFEAGVSAHLTGFAHVDRNGDTTIVGTFVVPDPSPSLPADQQVMVARYSANGERRFLQTDSIQDLSSVFPAAPRVDDFGRTWVSYGQGSAFGSSSSQGLTLRLTPQSHSFCHGDGSTSACPCGNASGALAQAGCANSIGDAARVIDMGSASLSSDTLSLTCAGVEATAIGLLVEATAAQSGVPFGDGLRCVAGSFLRLYVQPAVGGVHEFPSPGNPSIHARSLALGGTVSVGSRRAYQVYYRDADALFCPSPAGASFNFSNALMIAWGP